MSNEIGILTWDACDTCVHSVCEGGCDSPFDDIVRDGERLVCEFPTRGGMNRIEE